jgi:hypothetical protein
LEPVDNLEEYLLGVRILSEFAYAGHGAHTSYFLVLEGGAAALAKPADEIADGTTLIRRERAAWVAARLLRWPDLMAATVIRTLRSYKTGLDTEASLQVIWPDNLPDAPIPSFSPDDIWRGAIFDAVIGHTDRSGHNWLAVPAPKPAQLTPQLKLVDHGYAFPPGDQPPNSDFFRQNVNQDLPAPFAHSLKEFMAAVGGSELEKLLDNLSVQGIVERVDKLLKHARLTLP